VDKYLQIKTIMRGGCRRLAAVVSSFGCEMRANYIEISVMLAKYM